uniref:Uncharacterized protein n=1 Tax=Palpitomonas bilix TaxID=652834 RepID=A0A7S3LVA9_9EUKA|mmetsp:Transcript_4927/g.10477  ORF Transcript_4927/g.10477 Transcript_4927/m.10477 type:complete len:218 (+) Transcript_4927:374-1027(+)
MSNLSVHRKDGAVRGLLYFGGMVPESAMDQVVLATVAQRSLKRAREEAGEVMSLFSEVSPFPPKDRAPAHTGLQTPGKSPLPSRPVSEHKRVRYVIRPDLSLCEIEETDDASHQEEEEGREGPRSREEEDSEWSRFREEEGKEWFLEEETREWFREKEGGKRERKLEIEGVEEEEEHTWVPCVRCGDLLKDYGMGDRQVHAICPRWVEEEEEEEEEV